MPQRLPGEPVLLRGVGMGQIWFAMPARLVQDSDSLIAFYWCAGTRWKAVKRKPLAVEIVNGIRLPVLDATWTRSHVLELYLPGASHAACVMWNAASLELNCWYVNLQAPLRRTRLGFDTMDYMLDVVVSPDRSESHWKDEEEFQAAVEAGVFSASEAAAIRAEGERAVSLLQAADSPYGRAWASWRPPEAWGIPTVPVDWDSESFADR